MENNVFDDLTNNVFEINNNEKKRIKREKIKFKKAAKLSSLLKSKKAEKASKNIR